MTALYAALRATAIAGAAGSAAALFLWVLLSCVRRASLSWQYRLWIAAGVLFLLPLRIVLPQTVTPAPLTMVTVYIRETAARPLSAPQTAVTPITWGEAAALVWLAVAVGIFLYYTVGYTVGLWRLRRATCEVSCPVLADYTARRVTVRRGACVMSPLLAGVFRPTLYLPERDFDDIALRHVVAHETVHLHRGDLWIKRLCLLVRCLHWYNPAAHLVCCRIAATCETSCDTVAIRKCGGDTAAYLGTVLSLLCEQRQTPLTTAMAGGARRLKARFRAVSEHRPHRAVTVPVVVVSAVLFVGLLCVGGVYAGRHTAPATSPVTLPYTPPVTMEGEGAPHRVEEDVNGDWHWPLSQKEAVVSAAYGYRWGRLHCGVDIAADVGETVVAVADGKVIACEEEPFNGGYGMAVVIDHGNGLQTLYAHLGKIAVSAGEQVAAGQTIAVTGMTGEVTGPCLHFEVRVNGEAVDPLSWFDNVHVLKGEENENETT